MLKPNSSDDGFSITIDTETHGKMTMESKFCEDGAKMVSCFVSNITLKYKYFFKYYL